MNLAVFGVFVFLFVFLGKTLSRRLPTKHREWLGPILAGVFLGVIGFGLKAVF